jgi:hypothetical protein
LKISYMKAVSQSRTTAMRSSGTFQLKQPDE